MTLVNQRQMQICTRRIDPQDPYAPLEYGLMEQTVEVGHKTRRFLTYIPDGTRSSTAGVYVLGANGMTAEDLLKYSGWRETAETAGGREKMIVFFLEPECGCWNTEEPYGTPDGDVAYIHAVYQKATERFHYCVHEAKHYLYGEKEGAAIAHMAAASNPAIYAGLATFDTHDIHPGYLSTCGGDDCTDLMGFQDLENRQNRKKKEIPLPVCLVESNLDNTAANKLQSYWCKANETAIAPQLLPDGSKFFYRMRDTEYPINQDKRACCVWRVTDPQYAEKNAPQRTKDIWVQFLSKHRRWMGDPCGDLRMTLDLEYNLGMEYHLEEIEGWMREWYVYVPDSIKEHPRKPAPLVFAMHGYSCSGEVYAGNSGWYRVAQDRGFIVVHPTALPCRLMANNLAVNPKNLPLPGWNYLHDLENGPDEFVFFKEMLERTCAEHAVDRSRVYITGHSHGSMMTQALALGKPELFAAAAPCSGVILDFAFDQFTALPELWKNKVAIPVWMFAGEEEGWLIDKTPLQENATGKTLAIWHKRDQLPGTAEEHFDDKRTCYRDRWHDLTYQDSQGRPMLKYTTVSYMPHATMPEMSYRIWDEFFSHWSRENGELRYR